MFVLAKVKREKKNHYCFTFFPPTDIQECYEVTLQLNAEQTVVKEDSGQDVWEVILLLHILL